MPLQCHSDASLACWALLDCFRFHWKWPLPSASASIWLVSSIVKCLWLMRGRFSFCRYEPIFRARLCSQLNANVSGVELTASKRKHEEVEMDDQNWIGGKKLSSHLWWSDIPWYRLIYFWICWCQTNHVMLFFLTTITFHLWTVVSDVSWICF